PGALSPGRGVGWRGLPVCGRESQGLHADLRNAGLDSKDARGVRAQGHRVPVSLVLFLAGELPESRLAGLAGLTAGAKALAELPAATFTVLGRRRSVGLQVLVDLGHRDLAVQVGVDGRELLLQLRRGLALRDPLIPVLVLGGHRLLGLLPDPRVPLLFALLL